MEINQDLQSLSDEELVALCQREDDRPFSELFRRHYRFVLGVCRSVLRDEPAAEDIAQDVFVRVHRGLRKFDGRAKLTTWLYKIAMNASRNELRRRRRRPHDHAAAVDLGAVAERPSTRVLPDDELASREDFRRFMTALGSLSPGQREVIEMADIERLSFAEIAMRLNIGESAAKMRAHRARIALKKAHDHLIERGGHGSAS